MQPQHIKRLGKIEMPDQQKIKNSAILYIEDDAITREQLSQYLQPQCKVLYTAADGEEGLECYKKFEPEIVITDIEMPKLNGLMMINEIRKISLSTQIIIITAYRKPQYLLEAVNLQLVQYLIKPISLEKMTAVLTFAANFMEGKLETKKVIGRDLCYDTYSKELTAKNSIINLSKHERALIELLIKKHPSPASYESIDAHVYNYGASKNAIKLLVSSLREKTGRQSVVNISGFGYKLNLVDDQ